MQPKELCTVRVSNVSPGLHIRELEHFFKSHGLRTIRNISLCPSSCREDAPLVATVTLKSPSDARRALDLNDKTLGRLRASVERDFMGLTVLDAPTDSVLDIIAVHGLSGHAFGTWACHDEDQANLETMWLRDFLPTQIRGARILTYGYNSTLLGPDTSVSTVRDFASDLLQRILADRDLKKHRTRPLIFVCHSLGGIVVKQTLICAHASPERYSEIEAATRSILFLATPHGGSKSANVGSLLANVAALAFQRPPKQLLDTLKYESDVLSQLSEDFRAIHHPFDIINFYERRKTSILNSLVVDDISARLGVEKELLIPIDADHRHICKFNNPSDPRYLPVLAELRRCVEKASRKSWIPAHSIPANRLLAAQPGHFLVPLPMNPQFVGRESELRLLDQHLRAKEGETDLIRPIVAIHGLGGVGKTQLANKYVHDRRRKDPTASIFWITARSEDEITAGFHAIVDMLSDRLAQEPLGNRLELVTNWLCSPSHEDWLLVLDNYDDVRVDLREFLPAGMLGAVLITSRDRKAIGSVATSGLALSAMDAVDAGRLFLDIQGSSTEILRNKATAHPEADILEDILKELQYFPLAIDQAASFIRENSPMTFQEYLEYLKPRSVNRERLMRFKQANPMYPESVMTTWEISLEYLEQTQPRACKILQILGFLNQDYIAEDLLTKATEEISWVFESASLPKRLPNTYLTDMQYLQDDVGFRVAIGTLISLSMIRRDTAGPTLHVHPLVHEWIRVRLNVEPAQQARLTICATLVLYQSFPLELVAWVPDGSPSWSSDFVHRVDRVAYHVTSVLQNLWDYQAHAETLPLECFVLCETFLLAEAPYHSVHPFDTSNEVSANLDQVIRAMIPCLPQCQQPLAREIHKAISWLHSHSWSGGSFRTLHEIVDALEALLPTFPIQDSPASFSMLLVTLATDISRCVDHRPKRSKGSAKEPSSKSMSSWWTYLRDSGGAQNKRHREINMRLFKALKRVVSSNYPASHFDQWISLMIDFRIIDTLTPWEFADQTYLNVTQILSPSAFRKIPFEQRGVCLCKLARFLWEYPKTMDYESLRAVLSNAVIECKAELQRGRRATKERQDSELILAWSHSSHISSGCGRSGEQSGKEKIEMDLVGPIEYIWGIAIDVAKAISNPKLCWRTSLNDLGKETHLKLEQRRWAVELVLGFRKLRTTISNASTTSDLIPLDHFKDFDCNLALSAIYLHLEDWPTLRACLSKTLQFEAIVDFCDSSHPRPWESGQVSRRWEESQDPWSARLMRQEVGGSSTSTDIAMLEASSALLKLGIPESCRCICSVGVEEAIATAIELVDKEAKLPSGEISNLQLHLSALPRIEYTPTLYLSRLEIIYKLARHLLVKPSSSITASTPIPINSSAREETQRSHLEASDDESSDDSADSLDFGDQHSPTEFDWGWSSLPNKGKSLRQ